MGCVWDDGMPSKHQVSLRYASSLNGKEVEADVPIGKDCLDHFARVRDVCEMRHSCVSELASTSSQTARPFCGRCRKAQKLCICGRFKGVVDNKIWITIIQHPVEKKQAIGSARIALLGLRNVSLMTVPENDSKESFRIRPKVPGSKRSMAGRGGNGPCLKERNLGTAHNSASEAHTTDKSTFLAETHGGSGLDAVIPFKEDVEKAAVRAESMPVFPLMPCRLKAAFPAGTGLLFPSEKACELFPSFFPVPSLNGSVKRGSGLSEGQPTHLIVLDGTWSKAKRLYFENTWLHSIPHYKLSPTSPSLYEGVRKQPKLGCLSTLESIIFALKILEPETDGLDGLLEVFESMVEDQRQCKQMKSQVNLSGHNKL